MAAAEDWAAGADASVNVVDATGNGITASNVAVPAIASATYDASTGTLVVTGTGFLESSGAANDIDVSKFTFTGEGSTIYTLTDSADVEITSGTALTVTLSSIDKAAVNQIINKNGTSSTSGTTYNLAAAEDWAVGANSAATVADITGNGITASNVAVPSITSATYNASSGALVVTGNNFLAASGSANDIVANKFTFKGEGGATYTLTNTANVEITSATTFTITLSATDKAAVNPILNKNGISSTDATTYNLAAAEDWAAGADTTVTVVDATGNGITVNGIITVGNITYGPVVAQPIPTLSGPMFVVLGLLLAIIAFRALRAHSAGRPLASIIAAGIFALSATSGNQLIQYAQAIMPALTFDSSTGGILNVGVFGERQVLNNSGQPQRVISVTATPPAIDSPTSQQPRCTAGLTVQNNATCYVNFTPG